MGKIIQAGTDDTSALLQYKKSNGVDIIKIMPNGDVLVGGVNLKNFVSTVLDIVANGGLPQYGTVGAYSGTKKAAYGFRKIISGYSGKAIRVSNG